MDKIREQVNELKKYCIELDRYGGSFNNNLSRSIHSAIDTIEELSAKLSAANMERSTVYYGGGWIPISKAEPEITGYYLVTLDDRRVLESRFLRDSDGIGIWMGLREYRGIECTESVIAYMPLPEPFNPKSKD